MKYCFIRTFEHFYACQTDWLRVHCLLLGYILAQTTNKSFWFRAYSNPILRANTTPRATKAALMTLSDMINATSRLEYTVSIHTRKKLAKTHVQ